MLLLPVEAERKLLDLFSRGNSSSSTRLGKEQFIISETR
jgi:hypothetical protein